MQFTSKYSVFIDSVSDNRTINYKGIEYLGEVKTYKLKVISSKLSELEGWHRLLWIDLKIWMPLKIQSYNGDKLLMTLGYSNYSINTDLEENEFELKFPKMPWWSDNEDKSHSKRRIMAVYCSLFSFPFSNHYFRS